MNDQGIPNVRYHHDHDSHTRGRGRGFTQAFTYRTTTVHLQTSRLKRDPSLRNVSHTESDLFITGSPAVNGGIKL